MNMDIKNMTTEEYQTQLLKEVAEKVAGAVEYMVEGKIDKAMSDYNS